MIRQNQKPRKDGGSMKLLVTDNHDGEGSFPLFKKGTAVNDFKPVNEESHWYSCSIEGHSTYIPDTYVVDGVLALDYDPTEMIARKGDTVRLVAVVFEWLYVEDESGKQGWLPSSKAVSKWQKP